MNMKSIHGLFIVVALALVAAAPDAVFQRMGWRIQWVLCYGAGDDIYRVYNATDESLVREQACHSGLRITLVAMETDPTIAPIPH
jgi:hypothetical protein